MKIKLVGLEDGFTCYGFRKIAAWIERLNPDTTVHYVSTDAGRASLLKSVTRDFGEVDGFGAEHIDEIAAGLADADIVAFSSMTGYADLTKRVAARVREISRRPFMIWGGIHPIIYPEDAIGAEVDAVCTGEGEFAFEEFYRLFSSGEDYRNVRNFWFKTDDGVRKNAFRPLMTAEEMETLPFAKYGTGELIYKRGRGFVPVTTRDYLKMNGLSYTTVWSIGCPLHCTFCGNTKFIANDKNYARVRHPSARYAVEEVKHAKSIHGHIQNVLFHDDSFMAIKTSEIEEFARTWRKELNLPFAVFGVIPNYVREDKLELLTWAGMYRVRMGIQSGSDRILKFYKRPTPLAAVESAAGAISKFSRYHVNPSYDIIVDNPVETRQDVIDTLELLYRMPRPYQLNIFSLRVIPNTALEQQMIEHGLDIDEISANYHKLRPTFANALLYLLTFYRPPRWLFDILLKRVRATREPQKLHPLLIILVRLPWLLVQGWRHARVGDLSVMGGKLSYISYAIWKAGLLSLWLKLVGTPKFILKKELAAKVVLPST